MQVTVIATVLNEGESIRPLLDSLCQQTLPPDAVIITDGGSTDETVAIMATYIGTLPLTILFEPGCNISRGRNLAISAATTPIIASTDAGTVVLPRWLEAITEPIRNGTHHVSAGWTQVDAHTDFETTLGATVLYTFNDIDTETFLPSSRCLAFTKQVWEELGGYPEWLDYCEDLWLHLQMREKVGQFGFAQDAVARFRPRPTLRKFFKQYILYARGDGKADFYRKRHLLRYGIYLVGLPLLLWGVFTGRIIALVVLITAGFAYCSNAYKRLFTATQSWSVPRRVRAFLLLPIIRATGDIAKMIGYPVGVLWRRRNYKEL